MPTILIEKNIFVPMRDHVRLATDVYRPESNSPLPVLIARTPYNKEGIVAGNSSIFDILRAVQSGYVVVVQDVRGRFASEGTFHPHAQETNDGLDAFAWAASQPWSNGMVGSFGGSYLGGTQWLPAREQPASLKAMAPAITFSDGYEGLTYQGGTKVLHDLRWVVADIVPAEFMRRRARGEIPANSKLNLDVNTVLAELPLAANPLVQEFAGFYKDWLAHPTPSPYWLSASPNAGYEKITAPALNITGWYDIFLQSTYQNFVGMRQRGSSAEAREQRLIIGPWTHLNFSGSFPEREFGAAASSAAIDLTGIHLSWFDHWLKGSDSQDNSENNKKESPVMIFVMGIDQWRNEQDWPLPDTQYRPYYLHSNGKANSLNGDGELSLNPPSNEAADTFSYDPANPVPTVGGQVILPGANAIGPRDQSEVETREDVLVYSTPALTNATEVTGPITLTLFVSSSAPDTDFTGKLVDVFPDGQAIILTEGILRARYHKSFTAPELLQPGNVYKLELNLWATANVFLPGHKIRLEVSSSNFPRFQRNSNTGGDITQENTSQFRVAVNSVHHDAAHPSCLLLPIIERKTQ